MRKVFLSESELKYLCSADFVRMDYFISSVCSKLTAKCVDVDDDLAEAYRSIFTQRLAEVGFDSDYCLTAEGRMLERLIDRFQVAKE